MDERTPLISTVYVTQRPRRTPHTALRRFCTVALGSCLIALVLCFLLPVAILPRSHDSVSSYFPWSLPYPRSWPQSNGLSFDELLDILLQTPSEKKAREWSEYYTAGPHLAGKNLSQALWTRERWEEFGVKSEIAAYDVYINYPLGHRLALLDGKKVKYEASLEEDIIGDDPTTSLEDRIPTFHGYSASGNVTASYVYVNFGTFQDFEDLQKAKISLKGKIALAKYGRVFRGLKVKRAEELGMVGVVMYSDPQEDGEVTQENGFKPYPKGPARNPSSVQRGSTQWISAFQVHLRLTQTDRCFCRQASRRPNNSWLSFQTRSTSRRSPWVYSSHSVSSNLLRRRTSSAKGIERTWTQC
jgi:N-acetylated-alpha-linked acidic dipeptidase